MKNSLISDFRKWQKTHTNFMTPHILKLSQRGSFIIELSEGVGIEREAIYGVSVVEHIGEGKFKTITSYGKMFYTKPEAEDYFIDLQGVV